MILGAESLTVTRRKGGYVDGVFQITESSSFSVVASVQPIFRETLEQLPAGARKSARHVLWSLIDQPELRVLDIDDGGLPDLVAFQNESYQVRELGNWTGHLTGIPHRVYVMELIGKDEPRP